VKTSKLTRGMLVKVGPAYTMDRGYVSDGYEGLYTAIRVTPGIPELRVDGNVMLVRGDQRANLPDEHEIEDACFSVIASRLSWRLSCCSGPLDAHLDRVCPNAPEDDGSWMREDDGPIHGYDH